MKTRRYKFLTTQYREEQVQPGQKSAGLISTLIISFLILCSAVNPLKAQDSLRKYQSNWWVGLSAAANFNFYNGSAQNIGPILTTAAPVGKGFGMGGYGAMMIEYRPNSVLGLMLNLGFDNRYGVLHYNNRPEYVMPGSLNASLSYITIEPSLKIAPTKAGLYFFIGPTANFNVQRSYTFSQQESPALRDNWGNVNGTFISGQVGAGYEFLLKQSSCCNSRIELSPFVSYSPYFLTAQMRSTESLTLNTIRVGVAIKFGCRPQPPVYFSQTPAPLPDVKFAVQAPPCIPMQRTIKETLPLRNYVFFDEESSNIPARYVQLTPAQAAKFTEDQMQNTQSTDPEARTSRQMTLYHNIINIIGDRMRNSPSATITLVGSSAGEGLDKGKAMAETIKKYLVTNFGIDASRIATEGRDRPVISSRQANTTQQFALVDDEDRRVEIISSSPEIEMQYGDNSSMLKPTNITSTSPDLLDTHIFFNAPGADTLMSSWSVTITDDKGHVKNFGPFTSSGENIPGSAIMSNNAGSTYKIAITGKTNDGRTVTKTDTMKLVCTSEPGTQGLRYSVLFEFDQSKTASTYTNLLTNVIAPMIGSNSTVIVHGHTDIVGQTQHNMDLSKQRVQEVTAILTDAVNNLGRNNVIFQTYWFGSIEKYAPFSNMFPEDRFYNRTVIIDIIPHIQVTKH